MNEVPWQGFFGLVAGVAAAAFAVAQLAMRQQRALTDRFVSFVEASLDRHDKALRQFRDAVAHLDDGVRENTHVVRRVAERLNVVFTRGDGCR